MVEYFTIMIKENDASNLKLLTEKLNDGFTVDERIEVGKSTVVALRRRSSELSRRRVSREEPVDLESEYGITSAGLI